MPRRTEPEPCAAKVGARLRQLRKEYGLSLGDLADAGGLSRGHLSSVEHGLAAITTVTIASIARAIGLPPLYLLTFPEDGELAHVVDLLRKLPTSEVTKVRCEVAEAVLLGAARPRRASRRAIPRHLVPVPGPENVPTRPRSTRK